MKPTLTAKPLRMCISCSTSIIPMTTMRGRFRYPILSRCAAQKASPPVFISATASALRMCSSTPQKFRKRYAVIVSRYCSYSRTSTRKRSRSGTIWSPCRRSLAVTSRSICPLKTRLPSSVTMKASSPVCARTERYISNRRRLN